MEEKSMIRAAVLTISDSSHAGVRHDASGPAVAARLEASGFTVVWREVLPDERSRIEQRLREMVSGGAVEAIFTTGGTGVAPRDVTPEATRAVIDREIPGLAETMRREGCKKTPRAALSRSVVGLCGAVLVVNLPGSPKGALDSLDAIVKLVPHIVDLASGRTQHTEDGKRA
jgi:molybdopterin adenylyltransferase